MESSLRVVVIVIVALLAGGSASWTYADADVNFLLGAKTLDDEDWTDTDDIGGKIELDQQAEFGVLSTFGGKEWPVQIALDLLASVAEDDL